MTNTDSPVSAPMQAWAMTTVIGAAAGLAAVMWRLGKTDWDGSLVVAAATSVLVICLYDCYRHRRIKTIRTFLWSVTLGAAGYSANAYTEVFGHRELQPLWLMLLAVSAFGTFWFCLQQRSKRDTGQAKLAAADIAFQTSAWALAVWIAVLRPEIGQPVELNGRTSVVAGCVLLGMLTVSAHATAYLAKPTRPHIAASGILVAVTSSSVIQLAIDLGRIPASWNAVMMLAIVTSLCLIPVFTRDMVTPFDESLHAPEEAGRNQVVAVSAMFAVACILVSLSQKKPLRLHIVRHYRRAHHRLSHPRTRPRRSRPTNPRRIAARSTHRFPHRTWQPTFPHHKPERNHQTTQRQF